MNIITVMVASMMMANGNPVLVPEVSQEVCSQKNDVDRYLGSVNICDSNGNQCNYVAEAYQDAENGRVYVLLKASGRTHKLYAQRSNDSNWPYMIRFENKWYYFDL